MDENISPAPLPPAPQPAPMAPAPALTPEALKLKRAGTLKRLSLVVGIGYGSILLGIVAWAFLLGEKSIAFFDYLPVTQAAFQSVLMTIFHVLIGGLTVLSFLATLFCLFKAIMVKKEDLEAKKKASKKALFGGSIFFVAAVLWILGIAMLAPKLVAEERFGSPILTTPSETIGLTAPLEILFDASSLPIDAKTYEIISYAWNFGDGGAATGPLVAHRYTQKGTADGRYTVVLSVTYRDLKSGEEFGQEFTKEISIQNEKTAAAFVASPEGGEIPLKVRFDASNSVDPDGQIVAYEWDLDGDGRFDDGEGAQVEFEYTQEGEYEVSLRVTDNNGDYDVTTKTIEAGSVGGLRATITEENHIALDPYYVGQDYEFSGAMSSTKEGSITKYTWDFGDGESTQSRSVTHSYKKTGNYDLSLTVQDSKGNKDTVIQSIKVIEEGRIPVPDFQMNPASGSVPLTVEFDASTSQDPDDDIVEYQWDFTNDGKIDRTGSLVQYTYEKTGSYTVRLVVVDSKGNEAETSQVVNASAQGIQAKLEIDASNGEIPLTIHFDASSSTYKEGSIVSYEYDFGDGSKLYVGGSTVTYKYTTVGNYTATVTVVGDDGKKASSSVQIVVRPVSLTSCFTVNTDNGSSPLFVSVDPSCSTGTVQSYQWDFGDGEISFDRKPETHVYTETGSYTITLELTSEGGIVDEFEKTVTVR